MSKKIERVFREGQLSAEEVADDEEVRRKVQEEFPPAAPNGSASGRLSQALRDALRASDKSMVQIAQDAGVAQIVVSRFVSGERDIRMATADKLAKALGLTLAKASATATPLQGSPPHSVLDIPSVSLGSVPRMRTAEDDLLEEMLDGRS